MSNPISGVLIKSGLRISRRVIPNSVFPQESQEKTLRSLLRKAVTTDFGRHHDFSRILRSDQVCTAFREQVPIYDYDSIYDQWWAKARDGRENVAWKGKVGYYALSSGTSGAPSKFIPITNEMIRSIRLTGIKMYSGLTISDLPIQQYSKKMLMLGGSAQLKKGDNHYYGDLSGILVHKLPLWMTSKYKPGLEIASIGDYHQKMLAIAKEARKWDIGFITGIPSWVQLMLEYVLEYNRISHIHEIWPNLKVYAHGGTAFNPYRDSIQRMMGKQLFFLDGYLASEGFIAYQSRLDAPGMALNYGNGLYYEFVPFNQQNFDSAGDILPGAQAVSVQEVQEGTDYAILLSTCAGAWRYLIGDTVRFVDKAASELVVTGRTKHFLSICGEHLSVDNMTQAAQKVQETLNILIREFTVCGIKSGAHYTHKWYISAEPMAYQQGIIAQELDHQLHLLNDDYASVRKAVVLNHPQVVTLPPALFYKYMESKGKIGGQAKFPRVMSGAQFEEWERFVEANHQVV